MAGMKKTGPEVLKLRRRLGLNQHEFWYPGCHSIGRQPLRVGPPHSQTRFEAHRARIREQATGSPQKAITRKAVIVRRTVLLARR